MLNPTKTAVLASLLGGFALTGVGVAQAQDEPAAPKCTANEYGYVCVQNIERTYVTGDRKVVMKSSVSCSTNAKSTVKVKAETQGTHDTKVSQKLECSSSTSR